MWDQLVNRHQLVFLVQSHFETIWRTETLYLSCYSSFLMERLIAPCKCRIPEWHCMRCSGKTESWKSDGETQVYKIESTCTWPPWWLVVEPWCDCHLAHCSLPHTGFPSRWFWWSREDTWVSEIHILTNVIWIAKIRSEWNTDLLFSSIH